MIGTLVTRLLVKRAFAALNRHDLEAFLRYWSDDAVFIYPGSLKVSGESRGKAEIRRWFSRGLERFPDLRFNVRGIYMKKVFSLGASNSVAVESLITGTGPEGQQYKSPYVTLIHIRWAKAYIIEDFPFDYENVRKAWGE